MKIPAAFYDRPTLDVARDLIGKVLVHRYRRRRIASGMIVETEAYIGAEDRACHAAKGRTGRTRVLFGRPGTAYVYLIYGMYHCLNAVTEAEGFPAAVLIRAVRPIDGIAWMQANRGGVGGTGIASGPGKLCQAFEISRAFNEASLDGDRLWVEDRGLGCPPIRSSPRIGVDYAGEYRDKPWRFFAADSDHVTRHRFNRLGN